VETWLFSDISYNFATCGKPLAIKFPATVIENKEPICFKGAFDFLDIDIDSAKFFVKNKNTNIGWGDPKDNPDLMLDVITNEWVPNTKFDFTQYLTNPNYLFDSVGTDGYILIKVELKDGQVLNFKINFRAVVLANHFIGLADSLRMEMPSGTMLTTNDSLYSIPLPEGCEYTFTVNNKNNFSEQPEYDTVTNILKFKLKSNICREEIVIKRICDDCPPDLSEQFTINIKGADCSCDSLMAKLDLNELRKPKSEGCDFTFVIPDNYKFEKVVNDSDFINYDTSITDSSFGFKIVCTPNDGLAYDGSRDNVYSKTLKVLVKHKETGDTCLLTKRFTCSCPGSPIDKDIVVTNGGFVNVSYTIPKEYSSSVPFRFDLRDNAGNNLTPSLYTVNHSGQFVGQFSFNMLQYPSGIYHIVVENDEEILGSKQFIFTK
jgi:hypothetical protein